MEFDHVIYLILAQHSLFFADRCMNLLVKSRSYLCEVTDRMLRHLEGTANPSIVRVARTFTPSPTIGLVNFAVGTVGEIVEAVEDDAPQRVRLDAGFNAIDVFVEVGFCFGLVSIIGPPLSS